MASTVLPIDAAPPTEDHATRSLIFRAGGRVYCCDVDAVREVVPFGTITRLPGAPPYVSGLINVRGAIVTVIDAGHYLHGRPFVGRPFVGTRASDTSGGTPSGGSIILVDAGVRSVGLLVDTVSDVRRVRAEEGYHMLDVRAAVTRVIAITEDE